MFQILVISRTGSTWQQPTTTSPDILIFDQETPQLIRTGRMPKFSQCFRFDLANSLSRYIELFANFLERMVGVHVDAETHAQNFGLSRCEAAEDRMRRFLQAF